MLCYAMPCYAMPCHAMLCYAMPCHAMLCCAMLCCAMLCYVILSESVLCFLDNFAHEVDLIFSACDCDPSGITGEPGSDRCDQTTGRCDCKQNVTSRTCGECKDGYWNLTKDNPYGCQGE